MKLAHKKKGERNSIRIRGKRQQQQHVQLKHTGHGPARHREQRPRGAYAQNSRDSQLIDRHDQSPGQLRFQHLEQLQCRLHAGGNHTQFLWQSQWTGVYRPPKTNNTHPPYRLYNPD